MPTFTQVEVTIETTVDVDFEVFCARCNAGLCHDSDTRKSAHRQMPQVTVEPCSRCLESEREDARADAEQKYEAEIEELKKQLEEATKCTQSSTT